MRGSVESADTISWHPRLATLRSELQLRRAILRAAIDAFASEVYDVRPAAERWSIAEVIEHLARTEAGIAVLVRRSASALRARAEEDAALAAPETARLDADLLVDRSRRLVAPDAVRPRGGLLFPAAWAALLDADRKLDDAMLSGNGLPLDTIAHPHPALGPIDVYQWIAFIGLHELRHADQIREIGTAMSETGR